MAAFAGVNAQVVVDMSVDSDVEMEIETILSPRGILATSTKPMSNNSEAKSKPQSTAKSSRKKKRNRKFICRVCFIYSIHCLT